MSSCVTDDLRCPVCLGVFDDPVILPCSHSVCRACVQQWWKLKGDQNCPVCLKWCHLSDPPTNLALRNLCETLSAASGESNDICTLQKENHKLFCLDHQKLVCFVCRDEKIHAGHNFLFRNDAVKTLPSVKRKYRRLPLIGLFLDDSRSDGMKQVIHIEAQRKRVESKPENDFQAPRCVLQVKVKAKSSALKEEKQKESRMMETIENLCKEQTNLSATIINTNEHLTSTLISFMKNVETTMTRMQEVHNEPVRLPAGAALDQVNPLRHQVSPVCGVEGTLEDPPSNSASRNVCETLPQPSGESEDLCSLHQKKLQLFCLEHQELVCIVCTDTELHTGHKFCSLSQTVKEDREKLHKAVQDAKERLHDYDEMRDNCAEYEAYIEVQGEQVEGKIKKDLAEFGHFLQVEEKARLSAVKEEEQKKTRAVKEKLKALDKERAALSDTIRSAEALLKSDPVFFLKNFKTVMTRIQKLPDRPEQLLRGALLDEAKHVGNLKFRVWEGMKEKVSYSPVILDPNTARPELSLSGDLTSVSFGKGQPRPSNPERFKRSNVLGSALATGTHTWDVEVGDNADWEVGVAWGDPCSPDAMQTRSIGFCHGEYKQFDGPLGSWHPPVKLQRIRVHVDTNERLISFSESLTNTPLGKSNPAAWPHMSENMKMFPYFRTRDTNPLRIIPLAPPRRFSDCITYPIDLIRSMLELIF
ncbi:tripartite motif-containing protein 35-like [Hippocampus comes]|uniref:Tripartite motif-containing protein 35-like n=1 Tax=Hippocampus comes TaxID=109280 RepID=A0A3Q2Z2N0_HIPCM|nr:PREDICTED: tripartite motif-containing protein 35-like [Hippocampus comes]